MAVPTNTMTTVGPTVSHEREDLADVIYEIDPEEVPFLSNMQKGSSTAILHEWTVQELLAQDLTNKRAEGNDPDFVTVKRPDRFKNSTQILDKPKVVSGTMDAVDTVGSSREFARQKVLAGKEIKRDLEGILTLNSAIDSTDPRGLAGFPTWITNGSLGATGTFAAGNGSDVRTAGTARAFDNIDYVDSAMQAAFDDGGQCEIMYMRPNQKKAFSRIPSASLATNQYNQTEVKDMAFIGSASMYLSDFGLLEVAVSRYLALDNTDANDTVYLVDPRHITCANVPGRNFIVENLAKTGDNSKFMEIWEGTLEVSAPKAHAAIFDLTP